MYGKVYIGHQVNPESRIIQRCTSFNTPSNRNSNITYHSHVLQSHSLVGVHKVRNYADYGEDKGKNSLINTECILRMPKLHSHVTSIDLIRVLDYYYRIFLPIIKWIML
jgi:hypothetical protein